MSRYPPADYVPDLFNKLPLFEDAHRAMTKGRIEKAEVSHLREIFHRYGVHTKIGLIMLHRHFSLSLDERLIEYRGVATPWSVGSKTNIFGGRIVPRSWAFFDGKLHPTEFQFLAPTAPSPTPTTESPELEFPKAFVREFYDFVAHRGLDGLLGLTLFDAVGGFPGLREVERTVGRVSVTMPMTVNDGDSDQGISTETAWTFGCHERMDDSELMNARVCWVCIKCK